MPAASKKLTRSNGTRTIGMTDGNERCIYIARNLYGPLLEKVITHEIVHAFMFSYGIEIDIEQEEFIADFIATYGRGIIDEVDALILQLKRA